MAEAINTYLHVTALPNYQYLEQLREEARYNEAAHIRWVRDEVRNEESAKWQSVVANRDAVIAEMKAEIERLREASNNTNNL